MKKSWGTGFPQFFSFKLQNTPGVPSPFWASLHPILASHSSKSDAPNTPWISFALYLYSAQVFGWLSQYIIIHCHPKLRSISLHIPFGCYRGKPKDLPQRWPGWKMLNGPQRDCISGPSLSGRWREINISDPGSKSQRFFVALHSKGLDFVYIRMYQESLVSTPTPAGPQSFKTRNWKACASCPVEVRLLPVGRDMLGQKMSQIQKRTCSRETLQAFPFGQNLPYCSGRFPVTVQETWHSGFTVEYKIMRNNSVLYIYDWQLHLALAMHMLHNVGRWFAYGPWFKKSFPKNIPGIPHFEMEGD